MRLVRRARAQLRGQLAAGLQREAPGADRADQGGAGRRDRRRARARRDGPRGGPRRGCARPCSAAATRSRWRRAGRRRAGRAPPGCCCASSARPPASRARAWTPRWPCASWPAGTPARARPLLGVKKDLLDAYQAASPTSSPTRPTPPSAASARAGPRPRRWRPASGRSSRPSTRRRAAPPPRAEADAAFAALERTAPARRRDGFAAARKRVARALDGFTAAPVHRRGAGAPRRPADPLRRADPGRLRPRDRGRQGHDPVRAPGVDGLHRGGDLGLLRPRGGARQARPARHRAAGRRARPPRRATSRTPSDGKRVALPGHDGVDPAAGQRHDRRPAPRRVEAGRRPVRLRPDRDLARPHGGRRRGRPVRRGRAVAPGGLRVLRVRPGAEPARDRPRRGRPGRGPDLVRRRRPRGPGQADRRQAAAPRRARDPARARRGAPGRRRLAGRGRHRGHGGDQRRRDRLPRGARGRADPGRGDGQPDRRRPRPAPADADRRAAGAGGQRRSRSSSRAPC